MIFKEDWEKCKQRFDAFWDGEIIDRCCVSVYSPRNNPIDIGVKRREPRDLEEKWFGMEYRYNRAMYDFSRTYFGGEAFPNIQINLGPGAVSSFMGSPFVLQEETIWFEKHPDLYEWDGLSKIGFNENSKLWKVAYKLAEYFAKRANGDYMVCNTDLGGTLDIAAALRGTEKLLVDLLDYPAEVEELREIVDNVWLTCYDKIQAIINNYQEGSTDWYPTFSRARRSYALQCDFSAMISPKQFDVFVKPSLISQAEAMDKAIYHWDGPGEIPHLDSLLDIDAIDGIQWVPTTLANGSCEEMWYPYYKKIQEKGKKLILVHVDKKKIKKLLENISHKGLLLSAIWCDTEDEANDLLKLVEKICLRKG